MQPELRRNEAAVDSELAWLPLLHMDFPLTGPFPNWLYGATNSDMFSPTNGIPHRGAAGRADAGNRARTGGQGAGRPSATACGDAPILTRAASTRPTPIIWATNGFSPPRKICRELGFETTVDDKPETFPASFPMSQIAIYCGWYDGNVSGPFTLPKVEFMPGAFAYHLHSFSAATIRSSTENWCGPLLAKGATCTMGCVYEPYLSGTPNVAMFLQRVWQRLHLRRSGLGGATVPVLADHRHRRPALPAIREIAATAARGTFARAQSAR